MHEMFMFMCLSIIIFVDTFRFASLHPLPLAPSAMPLVVEGKLDAFLANSREEKHFFLRMETSGRFQLVLFTAL
jgi:hypothetical protein